MELFYQVFDKGKMEDSQGREINFRNTIVLITSNACSATIQRLCSRPNHLPAPEELQEALGPELRAIFKPALLGRMILVPYYPIGSNALSRLPNSSSKKSLVGHFQEVFQQSEFIHEFEGGRMHGIAAKITEGIAVLFKHRDGNTRARQQITQNHPGRPATHHAACRFERCGRFTRHRHFQFDIY